MEFEVNSPPVGNLNVSPEYADFTKAHKKSDLDNEPSSLHHTLGRGPNQAASGNHSHVTYSPSDKPPDRPAVGDEWRVTDLDNLTREWTGKQWVDRKLGNEALGDVVADSVSAGAIDGMTINGVNINGSIITGSLLQTDGSGQRVEISDEPTWGLQGQVVFYSGHADETKPAILYSYALGNGGILYLSAPIIGSNPSAQIYIQAADGQSQIALESDAVIINGELQMPNTGTYLQGIQGGRAVLNTNANGSGNFFHDLGVTPKAFLVSSRRVNNAITVGAIDEGMVTLFVRKNDDNTVVANDLVGFEWLAIV